MGLEQGRPQQFLMPDKGTGRPGGEKKPNILSNESKVDPSTSVTHPISKEHKEIFKTLDNK